MMPRSLTVGLAAALALFLAAGPAHAKFDPSYVWNTLETPHFLIHYHQQGEHAAKRAAIIAEDVHRRLVPRIRWEPKERTHIVLVDAMDEANGAASPIPYNQMVLFLTVPSGGPGFSLLSFDDWLRLVITHEYTHVLQLDMVTGGPETLQRFLGRIYFPNLFQPVWMIEGLATFEETEQTSGGRGRSPGAEMIIRTAVLENAFPSLGQASVFPDSWPAGELPYLFGEGFTRFIAGKYGRERLAEVSRHYSSRRFPLLVGSTGEAVLQEQYGKLWSEWKRSLEARYARLREELAARRLTSSTPLTSKGFLTLSPSCSPDGRTIAFAVVQGDEHPGIYLSDPDGGNARKIVENYFPYSASGNALSWSADGGRLYYTKIEIERNTSYYNDLYAYDLAARREIRITEGLRARDPHPSPDGSRLLFVMNRMGMTRLAVLSLPAGRNAPAREQDIAPLTAWGPEQYEAPRWSPDGSRIAVAVWQPGGNRDIRILDASGAMIEAVTDDRAVETGPAWSADGKLLYFSSDRTGIFNLYAYELATRKLSQLTNVLTGAFSPSPSPDSRFLAFVSYSAKGYDIHTIPLEPGTGTAATLFRDPYPAGQYDERPVEMSSRPYSPLPTIVPRFWFPWFGYSYESGTLAGALTFGQDAVQRHSYTASAFYGPKNGRFWYGIDYFYDGLYPTVHLHASDNDVTYSQFLKDAQGERDYVERDRTVGASIILPVLKASSQHAVVIGYRRKELSHLTDLPPWQGYGGPLPAEGRLASGRASYQYNSAKRYPFSISPEQGRNLELGAERFAEALGSDFEYTKYTADWHEYLNLPSKHHVLLVRAFGGTSTGDAPPQGAYQLGGDNPGDITLGLIEQTVTLRGYPANVLYGRSAALGSLEYRFPLSLLERGWDTKPFYYRKLHGALFFEAGNAWDSDFRKQDLRRSAGAEARLDMAFAYYVPLTIRFVFARGLDAGGQSQVYLGLWVPLEL